ncbi:hypothetical protein CONPUDRAFT_83769 [Coniophora puteana RWD-64-598 SS2]|uniref:Auxin efflux carrier n=1 Tax=Coniophora puteana (strain RWD-64-598) TaxID=741705 RepID=A0A5M3MGE0_CONPW|nr:uncharacterized protein CONPUDRAFT_83769 [Coniophora puteana RWD-64-598 SS2]EIW78308.1 hypothetical protein CONPUDRAFT_83769 [Coniophora puteana RWD-64-598 SS2]
MESSPFLPLLGTVINSILQVVVVCFSGYVAARQGVIDKNLQRSLNKLNVSLFTPALLFSKVAFTLTPEKLRELWIIPLFFVIVISLSWVAATVLGKMFRLKRSQRNFAKVASMFQNSNSLPIALMQSLVTTVAELRWDPDDEPGAMLGRALTYLATFSTLGMILRWSWGVSLLTVPDAPKDIQINVIIDGSAAHDDSLNQSDRSSVVDSASESTVSPYTFATADASSQQARPSAPSLGLDGAQPVSLPSRASLPKRAWDMFNSVMTPPLWAILLSIIVVCVPPLRQFLDVHLPPVKGALAAAGGCSIPLTMVVLGAYFCNSVEEGPNASITRARAPAAKDGQDRGSARGQTATEGATDEGEQESTRSISTVHTVPSTTSVFGMFQDAFRMRRTGKSSGGRVRLDGDDEAGLPVSASEVGAATSSSSQHETEREQQQKVNTAEDQEDKASEGRTVLVAVLARMVLVPLVLVPLFALSVRWTAHDAFEDPVFIVSMILLIASPPAVTLAQLTQAASSTAADVFERLVSRTIFWSYCIMTPPSTVIVVLIGLAIAGRV